MDTSYSRKSIDFVTAALRSPRELVAYLRAFPPSHRSPLDLGLPWLSFGAIREIERLLRPYHEVFEFGSGGSTVFLGQRAKRVLSVESHAAWVEQTRIALRRREITNVELQYHSLEGDLTDFQTSTFFRAVKVQLWDMIVIDCFLGFGTGGKAKGMLRPFAFETALNQVKPGGLLVLDDSWMFPELHTPPAGWSMQDFVGLGPCRWGVTSTAIYRRPVPMTGTAMPCEYFTANGKK